MLRNTTFALAVLAIAATSRGAIITSVVSAPTNPVNGPANYTTSTLTFTNTNATEKFVGFNFASPLGFTGTMNQVNPLGSPSVYQDGNVFFPFVNATPDQDSQFKVTSTQGVAVNLEESSSKLRSAFAFTGSNNAGAVWTLVQIAHPTGGGVFYSGTLTVADAQGVQRLVPVSGVVPFYPAEPASLSLLGLAIGCVCCIRRRAE